MKIVHVAYIKDSGINGIRSVLNQLIPEQRNLGNDVVFFNIYAPSKSYLTLIREFKKTVSSFGPDIVIFHSIYRSLYFVYSSYLYNLKIPYFIEPHGGTSGANSKKNSYVKSIANVLFVNRFIKRANSIIYLNNEEKDQCVFKKYRHGSIIIPNGIVIQDGIAKNFKERGNRTNIIYFSAIRTHQKGLDYLLPAIKKYITEEKNNDVIFHFYGSAETSADLEMIQSYEKNSNGKLVYHGLVSGPDKDIVWDSSDIFILTSRYEGMPMAVLEALSHGVPCILTPQTNMTDIISNNNCGWVVPLDINEIVITIRKAVNDYLAQGDKMSINAVESVKDFGWTKIAADSIAAYKSKI